MNNKIFKHIMLFGFFIFIVLCIKTYLEIDKQLNSNNEPKIKIKQSREAKLTTIKERWDYMFKLTRDPSTNLIPANIRANELAYASTLPKRLHKLNKPLSSQYQWTEVGPFDVGGRTRALAVDVNNSNRVLAGGVSGGIWESTDNGESWNFKSGTTNLLSVTSLAQDPRNGYTNTWYYATGEWSGNTASDVGAFFQGDGIFKSTDNGNTWKALENTVSDVTIWESAFDYVSKIIVNPTTGSLFISCAWYGILMSPDGGDSWYLSLGGIKSFHNDVVVAGDGTLIASLSQDTGSNPPNNPQPGIYKSTDDGFNWTNITPANFPTTHERTVLAISESNSNIVYALTNTGTYDGNDEIITLFKIDNSNNTSTDLSDNLPDFVGIGGNFNSQGNYNMVIGVKPDDENFVIIGGTSLFRSTDGFSTKLAKTNDSKTNWIGGYGHTTNNISYWHPYHHPDQHVLFFDPKDPNKLWSGHDGGLSYTTNITNTNYTDFFPWISKNNGYNVTQFYTVHIDDKFRDTKIMGGTQDNGTPHFTVSDGLPSSSDNLSSGDGSYAHYGDDFAYFSSQNGIVYRSAYDGDGNPYNIWRSSGSLSRWSDVYPENADGQLFINPFVIDPNDENIMYYPAGNTLWRNNSLSNIPNYENGGTSFGWAQLTNIVIPTGYNITALNVSKSNPNHVLYYGVSSSNSPPKLYKLSNSHNATQGEQDISIPGVASGAWIVDIAINPEDASEIIVVMSNYNIVGLYHSIDGGTTFSAVEGNLIGNPGPSLRSALIMPNIDAPKYLIGTSTGLYSTDVLNGTNTIWSLESPNEIGNVVVNKLDGRTSDNQIAVATHGRGIFIRPLDSLNVFDNKMNDFALEIELSQNFPNPFNPSTTLSFVLPQETNVKIIIYDMSGRLINELVNNKMTAGKKSIVWDGLDSKGVPVSSGIYIYSITTNHNSLSRKMVLLK